MRVVTRNRVEFDKLGGAIDELIAAVKAGPSDDPLKGHAQRAFASSSKGVRLLEKIANDLDRQIQAQRASMQHSAKALVKERTRPMVFHTPQDRQDAEKAHLRQALDQSVAHLVGGIASEWASNAEKVVEGAVAAHQTYEKEIARARLDVEGLQRPRGELVSLLAREHQRVELNSWSIAKMRNHYIALTESFDLDDQRVRDFEFLATDRLNRFFEVPLKLAAIRNNTRAGEITKEHALASELRTAIDAAKRSRVPKWLSVHEEYWLPNAQRVFAIVFGHDPKLMSTNEFRRRYLSGQQLPAKYEIAPDFATRYTNPAHWDRVMSPAKITALKEGRE